MHADRTAADTIDSLSRRVADLERRLERLERGERAPRRAAPASGGAPVVDASSWTQPYRIAELEVGETWIELHEHSARPQLQRLVRQVVEEEGPVMDRLLIDRVRRAWGVQRAGGRIQEAFDQVIRQLVARGLVERSGDALVVPGATAVVVRVPDGERDETRRAAEDVPLVELALALERVAASAAGALEPDELTMAAAKLFGWARRGGAIQERLDAALEHAIARGQLERDGSRVRRSS